MIIYLMSLPTEWYENDYSLDVIADRMIDYLLDLILYTLANVIPRSAWGFIKSVIVTSQYSFQCVRDLSSPRARF